MNPVWVAKPALAEELIFMSSVWAAYSPCFLTLPMSLEPYSTDTILQWVDWEQYSEEPNIEFLLTAFQKLSYIIQPSFVD